MGQKAFDMDICVIGGGASGLMAAIWAKRAKPSLRILVIEKAGRFGAKILASGNGRCNFTASDASYKYYYTKKRVVADFTQHALETFPSESTIEFFKSLGVATIFDEQRAYPRSGQAGAILDALRFEVDRLFIESEFTNPVTEVKRISGGFIVNGHRVKRLILATGGKSSPHLGSDGSGYDILKSLGHRITPLNPGLVQITTEKSAFQGLKGIRATASLTLCRKGQPIKTENGELLFTGYGLSGIVAMNLSSLLADCRDLTIQMDFLPEFSYEETFDMLKKRAKNLGHLKAEDFLGGLINKRLGMVLWKNTGLSLSYPVAELTEKEIHKLSKVIKSSDQIPTGTKGFRESQVTCGGVSCDEFDPKSMESLIVPGLFACGEILDVDGLCGGYNLQWAWSSGYVAGNAAVKG